jgi:hypothetical protein
MAVKGVRGRKGPTQEELEIEQARGRGPTQEELEIEQAMEEKSGKKKKRIKEINPEYDRGIQKIASFSGITRTMKLNDKTGQFDEIVNVYVYPDGIVDDYENKVVRLSKQHVRDYGHKNLSFWGRREANPPEASRHKKAFYLLYNIGFFFYKNS